MGCWIDTKRYRGIKDGEIGADEISADKLTSSTSASGCWPWVKDGRLCIRGYDVSTPGRGAVVEYRLDPELTAAVRGVLNDASE